MSLEAFAAGLCGLTIASPGYGINVFGITGLKVVDYVAYLSDCIGDSGVV